MKRDKKQNLYIIYTKKIYHQLTMILDNKNREQILQKYKNRVQNSIGSYKWNDIIAEIIKTEQTNLQFYFIRQILAFMRTLDPKVFDMLLNHYINIDIISSTKSISTFFLFMKYKLYVQSSSYVYKFETIYLSKTRSQIPYHKQIFSLENKQKSQYPPKLLQEIQEAVYIFPYFAQRTVMTISDAITDYLLDWILIYPTQTLDQIFTLNKFCEIICKNTNKQQLIGTQLGAEYTCKLIIKVFQKCLLDFEGNVNYFLIIDKVPEIAIQTAIFTHQDRFLEFDCQQLVIIFLKLTEASVTSQTLKLIMCLSHSLLNSSNLYALQIIYNDFIQERIIRDCKHSLLIQDEVKNLVSFYIEGFLNKIKPTQSQIQLLLSSLEDLSNQNKVYWIKLAYIRTYNSIEQMKIIQNFLKKSNLQQQQIFLVQDFKKVESCSWNINEQALRKKKKYKFTSSRYSGIQNRRSNCYIISLMQTFFMSKSFVNLLQDYSKYFLEELKSYSRYRQVKLKLLQQLLDLFNSLKNGQKYINIERVKKEGPAQFRNSEDQQDCQHYLAKLFEEIEKQFKKLPERIKIEMQNKFKQMFEITIENTRICPNCRNVQKNTELTYMHSIDSTQYLNVEWSNQITLRCQKCQKQIKTDQNYKLIKLPEIFFLHLKRFDFRQGKGIKKMEYNVLAREFENHLLVGFIEHVGTSVLAGHYILYYRNEQNLKKWYRFSDNQVTQCQTQDDNQPLQLNLNAQDTVYLAIYKQKIKK